MNNLLSPRMMVGAAIVGIVGAAGVFIYEQIYAEKRRSMLIREVARLDKQVSSMRTELESLRELQKETHRRNIKQKKVRQRRERPLPPPAVVGGDAPHDQSYASDSEYFTDYQSVLGTDGEMDSEEFYDVNTDDEDDTLRDSVKNGHVTPTDQLDEDSSDKADAPKSAQNNAT